MTALTFLDDKYRTMPAGQLAASVLEAAQEARARMARRVMSTFEPFTHANAEAPELTGFDVDWNKIFGPVCWRARRPTAVAAPAGSVTRSAKTRRTEETMTENAYYANFPPGLTGGTRQLQAISDYAVDMFNEFFHDVSATSDWPGKDDSYAKTMVPQEKKQREAP